MLLNRYATATRNDHPVCLATCACQNRSIEGDCKALVAIYKRCGYFGDHRLPHSARLVPQVEKVNVSNFLGTNACVLSANDSKRQQKIGQMISSNPARMFQRIHMTRSLYIDGHRRATFAGQAMFATMHSCAFGMAIC